MLIWVANACFSAPAAKAQEWQDVPVYTDLKEALKNPKSVKRLDLSKQKLSRIPSEVFTSFPNMYELVLSKNKLKTLPDELGNLRNLRILKLDRNKFESLPETIGRLEKLEVLDVNRSDLYYLPESIGNCHSLERIIAWDTNLITLPNSLKKCHSLGYIDLRNIEFSSSLQEELKTMLAGVKIEFTNSCNCGPNP